MERNARRALGKQPLGRLTHLVGELAETAAGTRRLLEQTAVRLAGIRTIPTGWCRNPIPKPDQSARASPSTPG
ncbi:hypothetical protein [Streptomyces mirabilis]